MGMQFATNLVAMGAKPDFKEELGLVGSWVKPTRISPRELMLKIYPASGRRKKRNIEKQKELDKIISMTETCLHN